MLANLECLISTRRMRMKRNSKKVITRMDALILIEKCF
jgi:hypothetical protein